MTQNVSGVITILWIACYTMGLTRLEGTSAVLFVYILVVSFISTENTHDLYN